MRQHRLPPHRKRIAAGAAHKERGAKRFLEHGDAARDGGLRDLQAAPRGERAARARNSKEETQVVPIEHAVHIASGYSFLNNRSPKEMLTPREAKAYLVAIRKHPLPPIS